MELIIDAIVLGLRGDFTGKDVHTWMKSLLQQLVESIHMTPIYEPVVVMHETTLHGVQVIAESHIALEYTLNHSMRATIFSCKKFDVPAVACVLQDHFVFYDVRCQVVERVLLS